MGERGTKLICRLGLHHWVYSWKPIRLNTGGSVVVLYRECKECGDKQRYRVDQNTPEGNPIWRKINTA